MSLVQRFPTAGETEAVVAFFKRYWGEQHIMSRNPEFLQWQFSGARNPLVTSDGLSAVTIWNGSELVGMQGLVYTDFIINGNSVPGVWLCNLMVAPKWVNKGVGFRLMMSVNSLGAGVVATSGINPDLYPYYKKLRYDTLESLPRYVRILDAPQVSTLTGQNLAGLAKGAVSCLVVGRQKNIFEVDVLDRTWDRFFTDHIAPTFIGGTRTSDYLNWRYGTHPHFDYKFLLAKSTDGNTTGLLIYRVEKVLDRSEKIFRIIEIIVNSEDAMVGLMGEAERRAIQSGSCMIDFFCSAFQYREILDQMGWLGADGKAVPDGIPTLFQPLAGKSRSISVAIKCLNKETHCWENLEDEFYIVKSDGDQDRPN